jgi:hypothetical protein
MRFLSFLFIFLSGGILTEHLAPQEDDKSEELFRHFWTNQRPTLEIPPTGKKSCSATTAFVFTFSFYDTYKLCTAIFRRNMTEENEHH